ncbi:hypothetical protein KD33_10940 [Clostridium sp. NCR]|nr:hypothetical protein KD33_10940 [Clostridium sp. NCR]
MDTKKKIDLLKGIKNKIDNFYTQKRFSPEFNAWIKQAEIIISNVFPDDIRYVDNFKKIHYSLYCFTTSTSESEFDDAYREGLDEAKVLIESYIENLAIFEDITDTEEMAMESTVKSNKIFIVHGRDNESKLELARYLEKINLEPIILHEQVNRGKTIIEKIEEYTDVNYGIVLYTACDIGGLNDGKNKLQERARQNVIFEHGLLIGKIGRNNVSALVKGNIEKPNDIAGVVYMDMNSGSWKIDLAKELKHAGYEIDFNLVIK